MIDFEKNKNNELSDASIENVTGGYNACEELYCKFCGVYLGEKKYTTQSFIERHYFTGCVEVTKLELEHLRGKGSLERTINNEYPYWIWVPNKQN